MMPWKVPPLETIYVRPYGNNGIATRIKDELSTETQEDETREDFLKFYTTKVSYQAGLYTNTIRRKR